MRTTLNLHESLLAVAKARARQQGRSLGEVVSELALAGLDAEASEPVTRSGLTLLPTAAGAVVTDEMVAEALDDK